MSTEQLINKQKLADEIVAAYQDDRPESLGLYDRLMDMACKVMSVEERQALYERLLALECQSLQVSVLATDREW